MLSPAVCCAGISADGNLHLTVEIVVYCYLCTIEPSNSAWSIT